MSFGSFFGSLVAMTRATRLPCHHSSPTTSIHTQQVITTRWVAISSPTTSKHPRRVVLTRQVAFLAPPPRPSHIMQHPTSPTTCWVFLRPSCILQPPTSRFDLLGGLFPLLLSLHPPTSSRPCPTSSQPHYATPNESNDLLGVFTTLLHSTTPNESI